MLLVALNYNTIYSFWWLFSSFVGICFFNISIIYMKYSHKLIWFHLFWFSFVQLLIQFMIIFFFQKYLRSYIYSFSKDFSLSSTHLWNQTWKKIHYSSRKKQNRVFVSNKKKSHFNNWRQDRRFCNILGQYFTSAGFDFEIFTADWHFNSN